MYQVHVARMLFAVNNMAPVRVNVYPIIMAIHTKAVGQSVLLTQTVHRIELVFEINAKIHVQAFAIQMPIVEL